MDALIGLMTSLAGGLWKRPPVLLVLVLNLVPVGCVIWLHWSILMLLVVYWMENVVIGVFTAAKMVAAGAAKGWLGGVGSLLFNVPFFVIHYGIFCLGHGLFVLAIGGVAAGGGLPLDDPFTAVVPLLAPHKAALFWTAAALAAAQGASFVRWLGRGEFRSTSPDLEMGKPYGRIIVLHVTLLLGAFLSEAMHDPVWVVALLGLLKTVYETAATANRVMAREGRQAVSAAA